MEKATLFTTLSERRIRCDTCAHHCLLASEETGTCGVMQNRKGVLYSLNYGRCAAMHADPIEKKPFFHFSPGKRAFSVAAAGCNMSCLHCQNWELSQSPAGRGRIYGDPMSAEALVERARRAHCDIVAYTYSEPAVFLDYARAIAAKARDHALKNVFVTNGFWSEQGLEKIGPLMDGANVDLKFFTDRHYRDVCGARLKPVLKTIERMKELGIWLEVTTLVIPGLNDEEDQLRGIAEYIAGIDPDIAWHVSRFHPSFRMQDRLPTPVSSIMRAREIGFESGLRFVYTGNLPGEEGESTFCPFCGALLIRRFGYTIQENRLEQGKCPDCRSGIAGIWQ